MNDTDPSASHVIVYSSPFCGYCAAVKRLLRNKGTDFTEINVLANPERRREMVELSQRQTVPQVFIGGRHIGGYRELVALESADALDALISEEA